MFSETQLLKTYKTKSGVERIPLLAGECTPAMKAFIKAYKDDHDIEKQAVYVFLMNMPHKTTTLQGYMPFNKQFAFVFTASTDDGATAHNIAHEIAHGTFNLRHTFSPENRYVLSPGTTDNLMDYADISATRLDKYQWDLLHNPENVLFAWTQDEEEGALMASKNPEKVKAILEFIRNSYIESSTGIVNLYEHGSYFEIYGDVSLIEGCSSKIHITMGMDAWESGEILIDKEEMLETDDPLKTGYDYAISYFNKGRHDNKFAINIYCEKVDKYLLKDYLTGVSENQLQCIDVPNCDDVDTDLPYNANEAITNILNSIRSANIGGQTSTSVQWPESAGNSMIGCEINLYEDLNFRIAVTKELYAQNIKTKMSSVTYNSHNRPASGWEVVKAFLNELGASFKLGEFSGEEKLRVFQFSDVNKPDHELSIVVEDKYVNILGHYLFGESWETDFTETDRQWVLYIYSPDISGKFEAVKAQTEGNLLEQRRLTYYALTNQFPDNSISRLAGSSNSFLSNFNYAAQLKHNPSAETKGVTVYTYTAGSNGIKISETPIQYNYNPEFNENDIYYPVDVKLWDGDNNQPALGNDYYGEYDFKGKYREGTFAVGPPTGGGGVISGYLRGFGYNEFYYAGVGATATYTLEASGEAGLVDGTYKGEGKPTPLNFCGPGTNITVSSGEFGLPLGFALSDWQGYDNEGIMSWSGITVGIDLTFTLKENVLPASVNYIRVQTDLLFPAPSKAKQETLNILNSNPYYVGE